MFIRSMMNDEFECAYCNGRFRNTGHCPHCGNPMCWRIGYDSIGSGRPFPVTLKATEPFLYGDRMQTALEWALETILDELDTILDEKNNARGIVWTEAARLAGRKAMEAKVRDVLRNEEAAKALQAAGAEQVRAAVRRMYESKVFN